MQIVLANIKDAKALSYLKKEVWETTYRGIYDDSYIDNYDYGKREEKFKNLIVDTTQEVYVCKDNNRIVGYMVLGAPLHESLDGYELCINDLGIDVSYRGQGIGKMFVDIAKEKGKKLFNCCNCYNANAQKFYEKMGGTLIKTSIDETDKAMCQVYYVY